MTDAERIHRLSELLAGSGATVTGPFSIWALECEFSDRHLLGMSDWADLETLVAARTQITDVSLDAICGFDRLTDLTIGDNAITGSAIAACTLPETLQTLGLYSIPLDDAAVDRVMCCREIHALNLNHCHLSEKSLFRVAGLPQLQALEALGAESTPEMSQQLSQDYPQVLFRLPHGVWKAGACQRPPFPGEQG